MRIRILLPIAILAIALTLSACVAPPPPAPKQKPSAPTPVSASTSDAAGLELTAAIRSGELPAETTQTARVSLRNSTDATMQVDATFLLRVLDASGNAVWATPVPRRRHPFTPTPLAPGASRTETLDFPVPAVGEYILEARVTGFREVEKSVRLEFRSVR